MAIKEREQTVIAPRLFQLRSMEWQCRSQENKPTITGYRAGAWRHPAIYALRNCTKRSRDFSFIMCSAKLHSLIQASGIDPSPLTPKQANQVAKGKWIPLLPCLDIWRSTQASRLSLSPISKAQKSLLKSGSYSRRKRKSGHWHQLAGQSKNRENYASGAFISTRNLCSITSNSPISLLSLQKDLAVSSWKPAPSRSVSLAARIKSMTPGISWRPLPSSPTAILSSPATPLWHTWQQEWANHMGAAPQSS